MRIPGRDRSGYRHHRRSTRCLERFSQLAIQTTQLVESGGLRQQDKNFEGGEPRVRVPDFIIAGAGKSGSTSLWHYLREHPEICMARQKEPLFFTEVTGIRNGGDFRAPTRSGQYQRGKDWYCSLFDHCSERQLTGEASVSYFYVPDVPALIREEVPDVKLLFLLRDPVDRFYSHYWQTLKGNRDVPDDFGQFVENPDHFYFRVFEWGSSYKQHLQRFQGFFPPEQLEILFHDDLVTQPEEVLDQCCRFLGVADEFRPDNLGQKFNPASLPRSDVVQKLLQWVRGSPMKRFLPRRIRETVSAFVSYLSEFNKTEIDYDPMAPHLRRRLLQRFLEDVEYVEKLSGRDLTAWKTVGQPEHES